MTTEQERGATDLTIRPETPDVSEIQSSGVAASVPPSQIATGGPLGQPTGGQKTARLVDSNAIVVPASYTTLLKAAKGKVVDSATWLAAFWIRMIKKAVLLGRRIIYKG